jgi:hypothetical protein
VIFLLKFLYRLVLFEKFIEQHSVDSLVSNGVNLAVRIADDELGIELLCSAPTPWAVFCLPC